MNEYTVLLNWDDEASKWYALNEGIPIILEDASLDTLIDRVKMAVGSDKNLQKPLDI
jgi:hypothetical protein